jgi:hypothetical protein
VDVPHAAAVDALKRAGNEVRLVSSARTFWWVLPYTFLTTYYT